MIKAIRWPGVAIFNPHRHIPYLKEDDLSSFPAITDETDDINSPYDKATAFIEHHLHQIIFVLGLT